MVKKPRRRLAAVRALAADKKALFLTAWRKHAGQGAPEPLTEHYFARPRRFRVDFAFPISETGPVRGVSVEVDGGQFMVRRTKQGRVIPVGRHNKDSDRRKGNLAAELGWLVLHYTPEMIRRDPAGVVHQVLKTLERFR